MKKIFSLMAMTMLVLSVMPVVLGNDTGTGIGIDIGVEKFEPRLWMCDNRVVIDDDLEPGRVDGREVLSEKVETCEKADENCRTSCDSGEESFCYSFDGAPSECVQFEQSLDCETTCSELTKKWSCDILKGNELIERSQNYAFEGEKIEWLTLVMDKNKIEEVTDVSATVDGDGEVECVRLNGFASPGERLKDFCNARIDEEELKQFDDQTMAFYECTLTVEPSMYGEAWITVEAESVDGTATMDENEYWFLNPIIAVSVDGTVDFSDVRPGTVAYSDTILVGNDADVGSGVLLDMFISGTDFYDPDNSGARCVITNRLKLGNNYVSGSNNYPANVSTLIPANKCNIGFGDTDDHFCYYATNGAYGTQGDLRSDAEGYAPIVYGNTFTTDFYNDAEIIQDNPMEVYWGANLLTPGAEMAITFKLGLPEPCTGDFSDGSIYFWGEAI